LSNGNTAMDRGEAFSAPVPGVRTTPCGVMSNIQDSTRAMGNPASAAAMTYFRAASASKASSTTSATCTRIQANAP